MQEEAGVRGQPALDGRRLVGGAVVEHDVDGQLGRDLAVDRLQELLELDRAVTAMQRPMTLPVVRSRAA